MLNTTTRTGQITGFNFDKDNQYIVVKAGPISHTIAVNDSQLNEALAVLGHTVEAFVVGNERSERLLSMRSRTVDSKTDTLYSLYEEFKGRFTNFGVEF